MYIYYSIKPFLTRNFKQIFCKTIYTYNNNNNNNNQQSIPYLFDDNRKFKAKSSYGGRQTVAMIPGSGIGPELMTYVRNICECCGAPIDFDITDINPDEEDYEDIYTAITSMNKHGCGMKGQISVSPTSYIKPKDVIFQQALDLCVNVVRCKSVKGIPGKYNNIDIVLIRQNTEGEYKMLEHQNVKGVIECLKIITTKTSTKVARYAFEYARLHNRKKVTVIHKANIMKLSDGLFLKIAKIVSKDYPDIKFESMIVDAASMQAVMNPYVFDVILTMNLYGNILLHILCGLIGGHATVYGVSLSDKHIIFELGTRSIAKQLLGKNVVNPVPILFGTSAMLWSLGHRSHARIIKKCILKTTIEDGLRTIDWNGTNTSTEVVDGIMRRIERYVPIF